MISPSVLQWILQVAGASQNLQYILKRPTSMRALSMNGNSSSSSTRARSSVCRSIRLDSSRRSVCVLSVGTFLSSMSETDPRRRVD